MNHTPNGRWLAMIAGAAFTFGGLRIILGDSLTDPSRWTTSVQLTALMVFGTIAAGHLMRDAAAAKHRGAALGFLVLFLAGTGLVVFNSVGRQAEATMLTASQADDAAERRIAVKAALARAETMLATAQADLARECKTGRGKRCEGIQATIAVYEAATRGHKADLEKIGPQKPVNAKAAEGAKIAALLGANEAKAKAALLLIEPFLWTLFFEIGSIVSLGFAFRPTVREIVSEKSARPENPAPRKPGKPGRRGRKADPAISDFAAAYHRKHGRPPSGSEIRTAFPDCPKSTAYDHAARARA